MKTYVQRLHKIESWENQDKLSDKGLLNLATYLFREGFIKVKTEWDSEQQCNVTHYSIEAVIEEEFKNEEELKNEDENNESLEEIHKKQKSFFERLFETFRNNN